MSELLDKINNPGDLKALKVEELPILASEVRREIINTVSKTGGHLAASLGAVEIAIAVHYVFDAPNDFIIWDVGHQAYAHKILTERKDGFETLRQLGGVSGFPNKFESAYDPFTCGHASTSISLALGAAADADNDVVAVIGDGSIQGGMAFEALNHAGHLGKDVLVILNDNEFSIEKSVGGFSRYLNRMITNPVYNKIHKDLEALVRKLPSLVYRAARKFEEGLKNLLVPGMVFEELGFRYFGPVDGHDAKLLVQTLRRLKGLKGPRLLHVLTKKGKGYAHAERHPEKFHGTAPFDVKTGELLRGRLTADGCGAKRSLPFGDGRPVVSVVEPQTYTEAFSAALIELAREDEQIAAITAAMPEGTGLDKFAREFPQRYYNVGIAEGHAVTFAAGMARAGKKPVVAIYSTFLQRSYDQILHDVALQGLHVIFAIDRAGLVGEDGQTHHGNFDIAYLRHIPGLVLMSPKDDIELRQMLKLAARHDGPVAIRYPRGEAYRPAGAYTCPFCNQRLEHSHNRFGVGEAEVLREGKDLAIVALGSMAWRAYEAAEILSRGGLNACVVNARFVEPLDARILGELSKETKFFVTIEEGILEGGFGSRVLEFFEQEDISATVKRIGLPRGFIEHGKRKELLDIFGLTSTAIAKKIKEEFAPRLNKARDRQNADY